MAWTVQVALLVGLTVAVAGLAHSLGRSGSRRVRLRRLLVHRATPWIAIGFVCAGAAVLVAMPEPQERPRRYADYLPDGETRVGVDRVPVLDPAPVSALAALLIGGGLVLTAVWVWLRFGPVTGRRGSRLRHLVLVVGFALVLAGLAAGWVADRTEPADFGWFIYGPVSDPPGVPIPSTDRARVLDGIAGALAVLGMAVLTTVAGYRAGRSETNATDGQ